MTRPSNAAILISVGLLMLFIAVNLFRPLMPVDETRYLSVAWEMMLQEHWLLPTLNFAAYSHKPPLLFWLIHASWEVFGVHLWPARIIPFLALGGLIFIAGRLARKIAPTYTTAPAQTMLFLCALPMFLVYGSMIMFDTLLGVWVAGAMMVLWHIAQTKDFRWWFAFGGLLGLGILTKGPVALVYMLSPALLGPLWMPVTGRRWYAGIIVAVLTGAAIALAWAIPAAVLGGQEYRDKIFITQSAGRMVNAFDHREPIWFYVPVLMGFLLPILCWPAFWANIKHGLTAKGAAQEMRFLLCWVVPVFVFFSAINSKQIHYMIPILPGLSLITVLALAQGSFRKPTWALWPVALLSLPSVIILLNAALGQHWFHDQIAGANSGAAALHLMVTAALMVWMRDGFDRAFPGMAAAAFMLAVMLHVQLGQVLLPKYDLAPIAAAIEPYKGRAMAAAPKYDGEYGYAMRIEHPIESIGREDIADWFIRHPDGVVIARYKKDSDVAAYTVLFTQPFRYDEQLSIIERRR